MTLRRRMLVIAGVIAVFAFGFHPLMRTILAMRLSSAFRGEVSIAQSSFQLSRGELSLRNVSIKARNGSTIKLGSVDATIQPRELLQRNLIIQSARANGCDLPLSTQASLPIEFPKDFLLDASSDEEDIDLETIVEHSMQPWLDDLTSIKLNQSQAASLIESQLQFAERKLNEWKAESHNSLRDPSAIEAIQKDIVILKQSIAEARVQIRERDKSFQRARESSKSQCAAQLASSIRSTIPKRDDALAEVLKRELVTTLNDMRPLIATTYAWAASPIKLNRNPRGTDVDLPNVNANQTLLRHAMLRGSASTRTSSLSQLRTYDFGCSIQDWNPKLYGTHPKKMRWVFADKQSGDRFEGDFSRDGADGALASQWKISNPSEASLSTQVAVEWRDEGWNCTYDSNRLGASSKVKASANQDVYADILLSIAEALKSSNGSLRFRLTQSGDQLQLDESIENVLLACASESIDRFCYARIESLSTPMNRLVDSSAARLELASDSQTQAQLDQVRQWDERLTSLKTALEESDGSRDRMARRR